MCDRAVATPLQKTHSELGSEIEPNLAAEFTKHGGSMFTSAAARHSLLNVIDSMTESELDQLPHGAIQLSTDGMVLKFNAYESNLANLEKKRVIGKNFFKEVAPCTDVQEFYGRFREGVANKNLHVNFRYRFAFRQSPRDVTVTLFYSAITDTVWVFVKPLDGA
jgi:photoactive yellow protein